MRVARSHSSQFRHNSSASVECGTSDAVTVTKAGHKHKAADKRATKSICKCNHRDHRRARIGPLCFFMQSENLHVPWIPMSPRTFLGKHPSHRPCLPTIYFHQPLWTVSYAFPSLYHTRSKKKVKSARLRRCRGRWCSFIYVSVERTPCIFRCFNWGRESPPCVRFRFILEITALPMEVHSAEQVTFEWWPCSWRGVTLTLKVRTLKKSSTPSWILNTRWCAGYRPTCLHFLLLNGFPFRYLECI